jgi:hypothetical protein
MSQENVKLVYEATDAFNRQDVGAFCRHRQSGR